MVDTDRIPAVYREMEKRGFIDLNAYHNFFDYGTYLVLHEVEWMQMDEIVHYEYGEGESQDIIPFAMNGAGDKWVWVTDKNNYIGLCDHADLVGEFYARNMEEFILRQIVHYVTWSDFYIDETDMDSTPRSWESEADWKRRLQFWESEADLKKRLRTLRIRLEGILQEEHLKVIDDLGQLHLKRLKLGKKEYCALLTEEEMEELEEQYLKFDLMGEEFEWRTEEYFLF